MMEEISLHVSHSVIDGKSRRLTRLSGIPDIFHDFDRLVPFSADTALDGHVLAVLLYAMTQGKSLRVHGPLSRSFMRNAEELQLAWSRWKPDVYKKIAVIPERIIAAITLPPERALAAFSGGADASFTALMNTMPETATVHYPLTEGLMVHGFDVDLENGHLFDALQKRVQPFLASRKLGLRTIRTNSKQLGLQDWEDSYSLQLAACLHMFKDEFGYGLIGSSESYELLMLPWGSSPVTDHLLSGDNFAIIHDGAGFSRTDKIAILAHNDIACKTLKVCWVGRDQSTNCGHCEKCVRTILNFCAAGSPVTPCFPEGLDLADIRRMKIYNTAQMAELRGLLAYAEAHGVKNTPWIKTLKARMKRGLTRRGAPLHHRAAAKALAAIGLKEPVKKLVRKLRGK